MPYSEIGMHCEMARPASKIYTLSLVLLKRTWMHNCVCMRLRTHKYWIELHFLRARSLAWVRWISAFIFSKNANYFHRGCSQAVKLMLMSRQIHVELKFLKDKYCEILVFKTISDRSVTMHVDQIQYYFIHISTSDCEWFDWIFLAQQIHWWVNPMLIRRYKLDCVRWIFDCEPLSWMFIWMSDACTSGPREYN